MRYDKVHTSSFGYETLFIMEEGSAPVSHGPF